jgi:hypothetical protein
MQSASITFMQLDVDKPAAATVYKHHLFEIIQQFL